MKRTLLIFFLILIQASYFNIHAQINYFDFEVIKGKVLDDSTGISIPSVNIFNESKRKWDFATEDGRFTIWVDYGDTLLFSAMGYLSEVIYLSDSLLNDSLIIKLEPRTYEIGEAIIRTPKKYSQFKQDVINLNLPRTELDSITEELAISSKRVVMQAEYDREVKEVFDREKGTLFVLGTTIRNKKDKDKKKLKKIYTKEEEQKIIGAKYNREIVKKYTKLNDDKLTEFMIFCNFSSEFLLNANDYEIADSIMKKYKEYQQINL